METGFRSTFRNLLKASVACGVLVAASSANAAEPAEAELIATAPSLSGSSDDTGTKSFATNSVEEVTVVGSRLSRADEGPAPVTVFDRSDIDKLGVSSVADVLNYLPQQSFSINESFNTGQRTIQLHGLSPGTTLVLIDGRRTIPGAISSGKGAFDLNTIPLAAVERIEVLASSASAVYGADAVGGVVNIVLKSRIERPVLDLYYGSAGGGADEKRVSLSLGGKTERSSGSIVVDFFNRDPLFGRSIDLSNNANYTRFGGIDRRVLTANPGNICAVSGNLPGLSTPCAAVPTGSTGTGLTPSAFLPTAGQQNLVSQYRWYSWLPDAKNYSAMASGRYDVADSISVFGQFIYSDRTNTQYNLPRTVSNALIPATNPFNPFGVAVRANYLLTGLPRNRTITNEIWYSETIGLRGEVKTWDWELSVLGAQSDSDASTIGNVDATRLAAALAATTPSQALNVFQDGPGGSFALLTSLIADPSTNMTTSTSDALQISGLVRGQVFHFPAGPLKFVTGVEWRSESLSALAPASNFAITSDKAKRESSSGYFEVNVPILSDNSSVPLARDLSVTLAGRYDHYSDFGSTFNMQYGVEWRPIKSVLIRGSYGESFRAPGLFQMFQPTFNAAPTQLLDPRRRNETVLVPYTTGGNLNLDPETSTSWSVGGVWTPSMAGRPRFGVTYWSIEQDQRIVTGFGPAVAIANEAYLPGRVTRADPTPADLAAGLPGRITYVDVRLVNLGRLETSGVDFEASARFDTVLGRISPAITATRVNKYSAADFPTSPFVERVGVVNVFGTIPRWRVVSSLGWSRGGVSIGGTTRYVSSYKDTLSGVPTGRKIDAQVLVDLQASVDLGDVFPGHNELAHGLVARIGANNLFDKEPQFTAFNATGFDASQSDVRQRFVYVSLSKAF